MKTWIFAMIMMVVVQAQTGCRCGKNKGGNNIVQAQENQMTDQLIIDKAYTAPKTNDPFTIKKMSLDGNILNIEVEYSGGCKDHDFKLYFNQIYMKSLPPKAKFFLVHNANGDACRELISKTYSFDISPAKYPDGKTSEIYIMLDGYEESILYKY